MLSLRPQAAVLISKFELFCLPGEALAEDAASKQRKRTLRARRSRTVCEASGRALR